MRTEGNSRSAVSTVEPSYGIQAAVIEATREATRIAAARSRSASVRRLIAWTDAMINELELYNLHHARRVSTSWRPRLLLLLASLPFEFPMPRRIPRSPLALMDLIYDVQERLFDLKNGRMSRFEPTGEHWN